MPDDRFTELENKYREFYRDISYQGEGPNVCLVVKKNTRRAIAWRLDSSWGIELWEDGEKEPGSTFRTSDPEWAVVESIRWLG